MSKTPKSSKALRTPRVHVVLDSNALFTEAADKLLSAEISNLILTDPKSLGLEVHWHIPSSVRGERKHQMLTRGTGLLIPLGKLEALLGHKLGMTEELLSLRVEEAIQRQMTAHGLEDLMLDPGKVDWPSLIEKAIAKRPPFSPESEKGFRDAIILEAFCQLAESLPRSPASCRVILLTADQLLGQAAKERSAAWSNVTTVAEVNELRTVLNAVAAHLPQDAVSEIVAIASDMFFKDDYEGSLWDKWSVEDIIQNEHGSVVRKVPDSYKRVKSNQYYIDTTTFISKVGQKVSFSTSVSVEVTASKLILRPVESGASLGSYRWLDDTFLKRPASEPASSTSGILGSISDISAALEKIPSEERSVVGDHHFNVLWYATLNARGNLIAAGLEAVEFVKSKWEK